MLITSDLRKVKEKFLKDFKRVMEFLLLVHLMKQPITFDSYFRKLEPIRDSEPEHGLLHNKFVFAFDKNVIKSMWKRLYIL